MSKTALTRRVGSVLKLVHTDTEAQVVRSMKISGDFPAHAGIEVIFDFTKDAHDELSVILSRRTGGKVRLRNSWALSAVERRDFKELKGFKEFADSLGLKVPQLAKIIEGLRP